MKIRPSTLLLLLLTKVLLVHGTNPTQSDKVALKCFPERLADDEGDQDADLATHGSQVDADELHELNSVHPLQVSKQDSNPDDSQINRSEENLTGLEIARPSKNERKRLVRSAEEDSQDVLTTLPEIEEDLRGFGKKRWKKKGGGFRRSKNKKMKKNKKKKKKMGSKKKKKSKSKHARKDKKDKIKSAKKDKKKMKKSKKNKRPGVSSTLVDIYNIYSNIREDNMAYDDTAEGNMADDNTAEGNMADDNTAEGNMADDNTAEGNMADDDTAEGNMADDNTAEVSMADHY